MKRPLVIAGAIVILAIIVFASVRAGGPKAEKVYAEPVKPRKIEAVVTAPGEVDPKVKVNIDAHIVAKIERLYFKEGVAKLELAVASGKQQHDKREAKKKAEAQREIRRAMSDRRRS